MLYILFIENKYLSMKVTGEIGFSENLRVLVYKSLYCDSFAFWLFQFRTRIAPNPHLIRFRIKINFPLFLPQPTHPDSCL